MPPLSVPEATFLRRRQSGGRSPRRARDTTQSVRIEDFLARAVLVARMKCGIVASQPPQRDRNDHAALPYARDSGRAETPRSAMMRGPNSASGRAGAALRSLPSLGCLKAVAQLSICRMRSDRNGRNKIKR